jgi:hypothetical protein
MFRNKKLVSFSYNEVVISLDSSSLMFITACDCCLPFFAILMAALLWQVGNICWCMSGVNTIFTNIKCDYKTSVLQWASASHYSVQILL